MTVFFGIGITGRFGNQIIEYIICKHLEKQHAIPIFHSKWLGTEFYDTNSPDYILESIVVEKIYTDSETYMAMNVFKLHHLRMKEEQVPTRKEYIDLGPDDYFFSNELNVEGKVLYHNPKVHLSYLKTNRSYLTSLFKYKPNMNKVLRTVVQKVSKDKKLIVLHVRKGDFVFMLNPHFVFVDKFYIQWLNENFDENTMSLYISGFVSKKFKRLVAPFHPLYLEDLVQEFPELPSMHSHYDIIIDHGIMRSANIVLAFNSSFSFTACLFSDIPDARFYRQDFELKKLSEFDPWNSNSYELVPPGLKWIKLYLTYSPFFGFKFFGYVIGRLLRGKNLVDFSYS
jgi:hypothetical protein